MENRALNWEEIKNAVIVSAVGAAVMAIWGYFRSISNKVDRSEFEKLNERTRTLESANQRYVTHEEFKSAISEIKSDIKGDLADLRQELRSIGERIDRIARLS